jgi:subfamily B ATP-binding cassette protein MsbA
MSNIEILKRLFDVYSKKYLKKIILAFVFSLVLAGSTSSVAYLLDPAIKQLFVEKNQTLIIVIPLLIILAFVAKGSSLYIAKVIMIGVAEDVRKDIQNELLDRIIESDTQFMDDSHTGNFVSNLTNDVNMIINLVSNAILNLFKDSLTLIGLLCVMFYQNWKLSLVAIIMIPLASLAAKTLGKRMSKVINQQMKEAALLTSYLLEIFKNHKLIKIFQRENDEKIKADKYLNNLKEYNKKINIVFVRASPIMESFTGIMIAILIFISAKLVTNNELEVSNFFSFLAAMMLAYQPVRSLATLNIAISQGIEGARRVLPIVDNKNKIKDKDDATELSLKTGNIKFKDVVFNYKNNERKVLKSINLDIPAKKMTALVGHSGAGKSTILNLIPRFYNVNDGDITIDDQSIYDSTVFSLRKNISLVSQETTLFDDTIKNNISYARPEASLEEIEEAAKYSFADEFINKLPDKYDTIIGENGTRLSGGEKQRLSIARAIIKKSPIILLDEATSSLDAETENKIQKAVGFLTQGKTTIVIAHRLSTILNSDKIFVIDQGLVVDEGNHNDLLNSSKIYRNFYEKQIKKG